jgi:hypothetical protein
MTRFRAVAGLCLLALVATSVYGLALRSPTFSPEFGMFYCENAPKSPREVLQTYVTFDGWYRPTSSYLFYQVTSALFGWHNMLGFRIVTLLVLVITASLVASFTRVLFPESRAAPLIAGVLFLCHPTHYLFVYENYASDYLYEIFAWSSCICFLRIKGARLVDWGHALASLLCFLMALTCKEHATIVPVFFVGVVTLRALTGSNRAERFGTWPALVQTVLSVVVLGVFLRAHFDHHQFDDETYHTTFKAALVLKNLKYMPLWMSHIFNYRVSDYIDQEGTTANLVIGLLFALVTVFYWCQVVVLRVRWRALLTTLAFLLPAMALPIYAGSKPWHVFLPTGAFLALFAVAAESVVQVLPWERVRVVLLSAFVVVIAVNAQDHFRRELRGNRLPFYHPNTQALADPPVAPSAMPHGAVIFYERAPNHDDWRYGGGDCLFRFAYLDPTIVEESFGWKAEVEPVKLRQWLDAPHAYFFTWDDRNNKWWDRTREFRQGAEAKMRVLAGR